MVYCTLQGRLISMKLALFAFHDVRDSITETTVSKYRKLENI